MPVLTLSMPYFHVSKPLRRPGQLLSEDTMASCDLGIELFEDALSFSEDSKRMEGVFHSHLDEKVRPYIDLVDSLRQIGIERDVALPAIAVIGDQSSGKSSLKRLKGGVQWKAVMSYKGQLISFDDPRLVESHIREAQNRLAGKDVGICDDPISLEISSHDVCDLTLIDLPGIARVPVKGQPDDIGDQIKRLIMAFVKKTETIMLVVVPCNVDIATTEALRMAQEVDPEGKRTLAVLTKPDLVDKGTERNVLDIVENKVIPLSKGYLIVKCRGQKDIDDKISLSEATWREREFFRTHKYFSFLLSQDKATTRCLANKLTHDLVNHIKISLPIISEEVNKLLWDTRKALGQFERGPPLELYEMKIYLMDILVDFNSKIDRLCAGEVFNEENLYCEFRAEFKKWKDHLDEKSATVKEYDQKHRGKELPGFSNYKVFDRVIQDVVEELTEPAKDTLKNKIKNIQSKQEAKVEERIEEQFKMEKLVYTQDAIYRKYLKEIHHDTKQDESDEEEEEAGEERSTYPERVRAYYEIVAQRLADQVPMLIQVFMLHEAAKLLRVEMLNLMDGGDVREILHEDSDVSRKRIELQSRLERLSKAQERLSRFLKRLSLSCALLRRSSRLCSSIRLRLTSESSCRISLTSPPSIRFSISTHSSCAASCSMKTWISMGTWSASRWAMICSQEDPFNMKTGTVSPQSHSFS
ncbi:hypothetical protein JZ751_012682 [Albula glossodonta]|uniref:Uncharacterized protein n=1 Tax=Albula glossodonta TaxID=121402 RepID=A0A8T2N6U8_9TELE|nr:hypothetical protein JZ751_012682 [Albula glossodonta]